jgi:hypothetical protein
MSVLGGSHVTVWASTSARAHPASVITTSRAATSSTTRDQLRL